MLKDNLLNISKTLDDIKNANREDLLNQAINDRLTETIHRYNKTLDLSASRLNIKDSFRILKAYNKWQKNKDKEAIKASSKNKNKEENTDA